MANTAVTDIFRKIQIPIKPQFINQFQLKWFQRKTCFRCTSNFISIGWVIPERIHQDIISHHYECPNMKIFKKKCHENKVFSMKKQKWWIKFCTAGVHAISEMQTSIKDTVRDNRFLLQWSSIFFVLVNW